MDRTMGRPEESALEREAFRNIHVLVSDTNSKERSRMQADYKYETATESILC